MKVPEAQKWKFTYVILDKEGERTRIVVPSDIHMVWCQSPALFCTATEAAKEVMMQVRSTKQKIGPSQTEHFMGPADPVEYTSCLTDLFQVFVDDFIHANQPESSEDLK